MTISSEEIDENLFDDSSTDNSENGRKNRENLFNSSKKSSTKWNSPYEFAAYSTIYEQIFKLFCQGDDDRWKSLLKSAIEQSDHPIQLLYMFLDHTIDTSNNKKHKFIAPLIDHFRRIDLNEKQLNQRLDEQIQLNILGKICRRTALNQLDSIVHVFRLNSDENRNLVRDFINTSLDQRENHVFICRLCKIFKLFDSDGISSEKIFLPLLVDAQWDTIRFAVADDERLKKKLLQIIDQLLSNDKDSIRDLLRQSSLQIEPNSIDSHSLRRAARKLLKQFDLPLDEFPNLVFQEKFLFLKTLFVRKYINSTENKDQDDEQTWNERIKELIGDSHELKVKLIDLFVDYVDLNSADFWSKFYQLADVDIPVQVLHWREEKLKRNPTEDLLQTPTIVNRDRIQSEQLHYHPTINETDVVYIEVDTEVDSFLHRLECSRCDVGSDLPFVGFDCETFMDPTQSTLSTQTVSILQFAAHQASRQQTFYGIFDMLALRLQLDLKSLSELAQRVFCSKDFILLSYNYAGDTSSLIENYPSMTDALMQGTAVIDLFQIQQHILDHYPQIFPYYEHHNSSKARGLSELARLCFGKTLDKSMQTSDWRKRPLKSTQLMYSVLDARVLIDIALLIEERTRMLNISWSWSNFKGYTWTNKAFRKRTGCQLPSITSSAT